ncbi:unnamed protein product [Moneuplotes crassus]|uniref:Uncharacterized protein n=1 Tax=Euplotes crassus TaxID=5936 RepID=A0AAD1URE1_EUPCR|nr:unnamed protein product [Moneuplotes crassus]
MKYIAFTLILILAGLYFGQTAIKSFFPQESTMETIAPLGNATHHMCNHTCNQLYAPHIIDNYCRSGAYCNSTFASCCTLHNHKCAGRMIPMREFNFPSTCPNGTINGTYNATIPEYYLLDN